jgi:hypothetical protein
VEQYEPLLITKEFCTYRFPPLYEFVMTYDAKKWNLENIRTLSYKCCQYNLSIRELVQDFLLLIDNTTLLERIVTDRIPKKHYEEMKTNVKFNIIKSAADIDYKLCHTNKGREPIYIEALLCEIFLNQCKKST